VQSPSQATVSIPPPWIAMLVASACMRRASVEKPLILRVEGIIAAGDSSVRIPRDEVDLIACSCFTDVVKYAGIDVP
jgi:hypothetical protein